MPLILGTLLLKGMHAAEDSKEPTCNLTRTHKPQTQTCSGRHKHRGQRRMVQTDTAEVDFPCFWHSCWPSINTGSSQTLNTSQRFNNAFKRPSLSGQKPLFTDTPAIKQPSGLWHYHFFPIFKLLVTFLFFPKFRRTLKFLGIDYSSQSVTLSDRFCILC